MLTYEKYLADLPFPSYNGYPAAIINKNSKSGRAPVFELSCVKILLYR